MAKKLPRDYQIEDLAFLIKERRAGLLHDPGGGKTLPACLHMQYRWQYEGAKSIFNMPKSLLGKNYEEVLDCTNLTKDQVIVVDGTPSERKKAMQWEKGVVFLMGFKRFADDWRTLKGYHPEVANVAIDEWHMGFKSHDSKRTTEMFEFCRDPKVTFVPMSGTLISGRLDSCYPAIKIIEPRYYINHYSFLAQHAVTDEYGTVLAWINHEKLGHIFMRHFRRKTFEEIYGASEEPIIIVEKCTMTPKQLKAYKEFEKTALLELEDSFLLGDNPAVAALRCRQIMAHPETFGIIKDNELTGKDESLIVHLEDHINKKEPILIYAALKPEQERIAKICENMGLKVGLINSDTPTNLRIVIDKQFREGKLDGVVGSPATAAVGYNWSHIDHVIFCSIDYTDDNFSQAYKRCIRGLRKKRLRVTVLSYDTPVERRIIQIVNSKSEDRHKVDSSYKKLDLGKDEEDSVE